MSEFKDVRAKQLVRLGVDESSITRSVKYILAEIDPVVVLKLRTKQKIELARYGRQSVLQWDNVLLSEFLAYHRALVEVVNEENGRSESLPGFEDH